MSVRVATLGKQGFTSDTDQNIDYLMCCFFFSKYSQSTLYRTKVFSLTKLIQLYGDDPYAIRKELEGALQEFLGKFFTSASVTVGLEDTGNDPGISLLITAIVSNGDGLEANGTSVGYSLVTKNSKLKTITDRNNGTAIYSA